MVFNCSLIDQSIILIVQPTIILMENLLFVYFQGQNGFEELRRYVKQGGDFGKELAAILQER